MPLHCVLQLLALRPLLLPLLPQGVLEEIELLLLHPRHAPHLQQSSSETACAGVSAPRTCNGCSLAPSSDEGNTGSAPAALADMVSAACSWAQLPRDSSPRAPQRAAPGAAVPPWPPAPPCPLLAGPAAASRGVELGISRALLLTWPLLAYLEALLHCSICCPALMSMQQLPKQQPQAAVWIAHLGRQHQVVAHRCLRRHCDHSEYDQPGRLQQRSQRGSQ